MDNISFGERKGIGQSPKNDSLFITDVIASFHLHQSVIWAPFVLDLSSVAELNTSIWANGVALKSTD